MLLYHLAEQPGIVKATVTTMMVCMSVCFYTVNHKNHATKLLSIPLPNILKTLSLAHFPDNSKYNCC